MRTFLVMMTLCSVAALVMFAWRAPRVPALANDSIDSTSITAQHSAFPVACTLGVGDFAERGKLFATQLEPLIREVQELDDGYALRFEAADEVLKDLVHWIDGERKCCAFLTFAVTVNSGGGPIWFDMTGSPDAKQFVDGLLNRMDDVKRSTTLTKAACCAPAATRPASIDATLPVVCTLGVGDFAERGQLFATKLEPLIREVKELDDGYALRFETADGVLKDLVHWIDGERACCAFLTFRVSVEAGGGPIWFDMTGSPDAKGFVKAMLDRNG